MSIVRVSGPSALDALRALAGPPPLERRAALRWLVDPHDGERIDQALVLGFAAPASFTGEDVAELHLHGSPWVRRRIAAALSEMNGLRQAEPGEFTRRALLNGRLDLAQVEGLGDLLVAETAAQSRQALGLIDGSLSRMAAAWRDAIVRALAHLTAIVDFADDDIPEDVLARIEPMLRPVLAEMKREISGSLIAERIRDGFEVALVGAPNVGKSTLLNTLAGRDAALVSTTAGTTRDVIEVRMDLGGLPVTVLDMAGLRPAQDDVEAAGIARARARADRADLRVFLQQAGEHRTLGVTVRDGDLVVGAKADLGGFADGLAVSGRTGEGVDAVLAALRDELQRRAVGAGTASRERQRAAITQASASVSNALHGFYAAAPQLELAAADLQASLQALDFLVGKVDVEAILDVVFDNFCLGK